VKLTPLLGYSVDVTNYMPLLAPEGTGTTMLVAVKKPVLP